MTPEPSGIESRLDEIGARMRDLEARSAGLPVASIVTKPFNVDDLLIALERLWES